MRLALLVLVFAVAAATPAGAVTLVAPAGDPPLPPRLQHWADTSLVPTPPATITVHMANCYAYTTPTACSLPGEIWMCPRWCHRDAFRHELGHQFDYYVMNDFARTSFMDLISPAFERQWREGTYASPHEQFAEAWRLCAAVRHVNPNNVTTAHNYDPRSRREYDQACFIIRYAAYVHSHA